MLRETMSRETTSCSEEVREHVEMVLERSLGAGWARAAEVVRVVRVQRVTLEEQSGRARRALIWEGPEDITAHLEAAELVPAVQKLSRRALCLDVMTEALQRRVSATMERWAKASFSYPIVSVQLATEQVAEVRLRGSRRRALVGMRSARLLAVYEPHARATGAVLAGVGGLGIASCLLALGQPTAIASMLGVIVTLSVLLLELSRRPHALRIW
jgi:hypothetical protein